MLVQRLELTMNNAASWHSVSVLALVGVVVCSPVQAALPTSTGWYQIPNTMLRSVCPAEPSIQGIEGCAAVTDDWSGGTLDTTRNRLIVWGGGHSGYFGNEVYALDLNNLAIQRLNSPSLNPPTTCSNSGMMPDGTPVSRHTYNQLAYIAHVDRMFVFSGSGVPCGYMVGDTWTLNLATLTWQKMNSAGAYPDGNFGRVTAYDPNTRKVYIHDQQYLYSYTFETDTYAILSPATTLGQYMTAAIDTKRSLFVIVGQGNVYAYSIAPGSTYTRQTWTTSGANSIVGGSFVGLAYDAVADRMVAWNGGDTVYSLDLDTLVWTALTFSGGPGAARPNGTFGRWAYSRASDAFVVLNSVDANAYALRLSPPTPAPSPPTQLQVR
jgi:hypothetical protein